MCRSIVTLRGPEPATEEEVRDAALQYVRKVSGNRSPSRTNQVVFDTAVDEVARATRVLLAGWEARAGARPPAMARSRIVAREKRARIPTE